MEVEVEGRTVTLPVRVRDATVGSATFLLPARRLAALLPGRELAVTRVLPGRGLLSVAMIDYRKNDLGDYRELSVAVVAHQPGHRVPAVGPLLAHLRGSPSVWIHRLPVDQRFSQQAGRRIWGFPKTLDRLEMTRDGDRARCVWTADDRHVLTLELPARGRKRVEATEALAYTTIDSRLHRTRFTVGGTGVGGRIGGAHLELGDHPYADELRTVGLPTRAVATGWVEHLEGRFEAPEPCDAEVAAWS